MHIASRPHRRTGRCANGTFFPWTGKPGAARGRSAFRSGGRTLRPGGPPPAALSDPPATLGSMSRHYLVVDIETVPDPALYVPPETRAGEERPFPPLHVHKPIVIGCLLFDGQHMPKKLGDIDGPDERAMLERFADFVGSKQCDLITFNGRGFDMPVIALRCLRHGVALPWYYQERDYRYRFSDEGHLDLCDFLCDHGAARSLSLDAAARMIGLPGKSGIDGSQVEGMFNAGQLTQIRDYCLHDVVQTAFLFLRFRLLQGVLDVPQYRHVAGTLLSMVEKEARFDGLCERADKERLLLTQLAQ
jgi:3'-5' exonuclease